MKRFQSILIHVDTRSNAQPVFERAMVLALSHQAKLEIVEVVPEITWPERLAANNPDDVRKTLEKEKRAAIEGLVAAARQKGIQAVGKVLLGKTSTEICAEVSRAKHDLVIKDAKGQGSRRLGFLGTTATRLMRFCPCTVWAFRPAPSPTAGGVVAAVDVESVDERHARLNREILAVAFALGQGTPHIVHVWSLYGEKLIKDYLKRDEFEALLKDGEQQARDKMGELLRGTGLTCESPEVHFLRGSEDEEIGKFVNGQKVDTLVMGTVGRSGISGMLVGNTAELLLDQVQCSVIAVKTPG